MSHESRETVRAALGVKEAEFAAVLLAEPIAIVRGGQTSRVRHARIALLLRAASKPPASGAGDSHLFVRRGGRFDACPHSECLLGRARASQGRAQWALLRVYARRQVQDPPVCVVAGTGSIGRQRRGTQPIG